MHKGEVPFSEKIHLLAKRYFFDFEFANRYLVVRRKLCRFRLIFGVLTLIIEIKVKCRIL